jgi:putative ABC transport system permease protein
MKLRDQFRTGWRNLSRQKLRTSLTVFAIVIGALSVTVMLSLVTSAKGFLSGSFAKTGEIRRVIVTSTPGMDYRQSSWQNWSDGSGVKLTDDVVSKVSVIPHVKSVTPYLGAPGFESASAGSTVVTLKNANIAGYLPNGTIVREMLAGRELQAADAKTGVLISGDLANSLGVRGDYPSALNTKITLTPRKDMNSTAGPLELTVVGIDAADGASIDMTMDLARSLNTFTQPACTNCGPNQNAVANVNDSVARNGYASIYLDVDTQSHVDAVAKSAQTLGVGVAAGKDEVQSQQNALTIIGAVLGGIGGIALLVAAIGVINTMVMATLERTREIGIMRAVGATKRTVRRLFTVEAGVLGFMGGVFGVGLSFAVMLLLNKVLNQRLANSGVTSRDVVSVPIGLALIVIAVTTGIGMLAGRLPARRAANLDPVEALRYE